MVPARSSSAHHLQPPLAGREHADGERRPAPPARPAWQADQPPGRASPGGQPSGHVGHGRERQHPRHVRKPAGSSSSGSSMPAGEEHQLRHRNHVELASSSQNAMPPNACWAAIDTVQPSSAAGSATARPAADGVRRADGQQQATAPTTSAGGQTRTSGLAELDRHPQTDHATPDAASARPPCRSRSRRRPPRWCAAAGRSCAAWAAAMYQSSALAVYPASSPPFASSRGAPQRR